VGYDSAVARAMWAAMEGFTGAGLLTSEVRSVLKPFGLSGMQTFFAVRSAPMGAATAPAVAAAFHGFAPAVVDRGMHGIWTAVTPPAVIALSHDGFARFAARTFGEGFPVDSLAQPTAALASAVASVDVAGRVLAAGNQAVTLPEDPWARLWRCTMTAREFRGDSHVAALVAHNLSGPESQVLSTAWKPDGYDIPMLQRSRGIEGEVWSAAQEALGARGLIDAQGGLTADGRELRALIETQTDEAAMRIWDQLSALELKQLHALLLSLSTTVMGGATSTPKSAVSAPWPPPELAIT